MANSVNPAEVYQYLLEKGIPENKVLGILASIQGESAFNPASFNEKEGALGLFQHRLSRRDALEKFGPNPTDWRQQVDYAASEPEWQKYLQQPSSGVADDVAAFTKIFEKPADPEWRAQERMGFLPDIIKRVGSGAEVAQSGYPLVNFPGSETRMPVSQDPAQGFLPVGMPAQAAEQPVDLEQLLQQLGAAQPPQSRMEQWMGNPLTQIGAGILTAPGNYGDWFGAVGSGLGSAIAARQESQYQRQLEQTKLMNNLKAKVADKMLGGAGADGEKRYAKDVAWDRYSGMRKEAARLQAEGRTEEAAQLFADAEKYLGTEKDITPAEQRLNAYRQQTEEAHQLRVEAKRLQDAGKQPEADLKFAEADQKLKDAEEARSFYLGKEPIDTRAEAAKREAEGKNFPDLVQKAESQIGLLGARIEVGRDLERKLYKAFDLSPAGGIESILAFLPGSDARHLRGQLNSIKGANIVETLKSLKQESTTGSTGLGGTSNWELDQLALAIENLDPLMGDEELREGIINVVTRTQRMMELATREREEKMRFYGGLQSRSDYPTRYTFSENKEPYEKSRERVQSEADRRTKGLPPTPPGPQEQPVTTVDFTRR